MVQQTTLTKRSEKGLLTPDYAVVAIIDLQPQMLFGVANFVKVVQRVPVKIIFDASPEVLHWIAPGMSVEAEVRVAEPPAFVSFLTRLFDG